MPRAGQSSKAAILRTFAEMIADHGYDEVSLSMVANELGLSKGTIVHHYGTKDRMLEAVHHDYMTRRLEEAHVFLKRFDGDPERQLVAFIAQLLLCQRDDRAATVAFAREIARFASFELMRDVRRMRAQYSALVVDVLKRGMAAGVFREADADLIALQIFGSTNWSWTWISNSKWSVDEIAAAWSRSALSGLLADGDSATDFRSVFALVEEIITEAGAADATTLVD